MNAIGNVIQGFISTAQVTNNITEGDYIGEDGLYYCGNCNTRKQAIIDFTGSIGEKRTVPIICKCRSEQLKAEEEERKKRELFDRVMRLRNSGFPEKAMAEWTFEKDDGSNPALSKAMKNYVENFDTFKEEGKGLLLFGTVGTGKTFLAACVANALISRGIPCLVTNFARIANEVQGLFEGRQQYYDNLNSYPLLVIDDLNAERKTEYMQEIVFNVIDARCRANLPLIITTNLSREELLNPTDLSYQRIFSRLFELCTPIEVKGKDRRQTALKEDTSRMKKLLGLE